MNLSKPLLWRKGLLLSATFLISLLVITSCKKKENTLGQSSLSQNELMNSGSIDTFSLTTYSVFDDSIITYNQFTSNLGLLGSYVDPVFGKFEAGFYAQLRLEGFDPYFGNLNTLVVDSFVLSLEYTGQYGDDSEQNIEVYEVLEDMSKDSTYYSFSQFNTGTDNLLFPGTGALNFDSDQLTVVGDDTLNVSQLRIPLSTAYAKQMITDAANGNDFSSNDDFLQYFKGIYVKVDNPAQSNSEGNIGYFNLVDADSKATIYYTQNGVQEEFQFLITTSSVIVNHAESNTEGSGVSVQNVINDTISGQTQYYAQAFGTRAAIDIPGLSNIPENAIVHEAVLSLPVEHHTASKLTPGSRSSVTVDIEGTLFSIASNAEYNSYTKSFDVDIRNYVQSVINDDIENKTLFVTPLNQNNSADRIIFNGPLTSNKSKPELRILYTVF